MKKHEELLEKEKLWHRSVKRFSKILISIFPPISRKKKEIDLRKTPTCRTPRKENQDERTLQGIFGKRCQEQETQSGAKGNFPVEILLHSWQPTFTRFLQRARLMAQERRYSRRRLRPLSRSGLQVRRTRLVGTKAWATFGQRPNPYRDGDLLIWETRSVIVARFEKFALRHAFHGIVLACRARPRWRSFPIHTSRYCGLLSNCAWNIKSPVPCVRAALETHETHPSWKD